MGQLFRYDKSSGQMVECTRAEVRRRGPSRFPYACPWSGVHQSQAQELRDFYAARGEKVEVTGDGDPVYTSRRHRKRLLKMRGMVDRGS